MATRGNLKTLRTFAVTFLALAAVATLAYAGLLSYYAQVVGKVTVQQSVRLVWGDQELICQDVSGTGCTLTNQIFTTIVAGSQGQFAGPYELRNYANQAVNVNIQAQVTNGPGGAEGVTVSVVGIDTSGNCNANADAPSSVPAATTSGAGVAKFCLMINSQPNAVPGDYTIQVTVATSTATLTEE